MLFNACTSCLNTLTFQDSVDLLLVIKSHYVYIRILTDLYFTKQRIKTKNTFSRVVCSVLVVKMCWQNIKVCLSINDAQSVRLEKEQLSLKIILNK